MVQSIDGSIVINGKNLTILSENTHYSGDWVIRKIDKKDNNIDVYHISRSCVVGSKIMCGTVDDSCKIYQLDKNSNTIYIENFLKLVVE